MSKKALIPSVTDTDERPLPLIVAERWEFPLRTGENDTLFCLRDWIVGLTGSADPANLIRQMRNKGVISNNARKINGLEYLTDKQLYSVTQDIRTTKARPAVAAIKEFLGKSGAFVDQIRRDPVARAEVSASGDPDALINVAIDRYRKAGHDDRWIQARIEGIITRKQFITALGAAVRFASKHLYRNGTEKIYQGLWDRTTAQLRGDLDLIAGDNVRDEFGEYALIYTRLAEKVASDKLRDVETVKEKVAMQIVFEAARLIHAQAQATSEALGIDLVTERPLLSEIIAARNKGKDEPKKITNEKPVSLNPVGFEDAVRGLLATPPPKLLGAGQPKEGKNTRKTKTKR
jgi:hypothetical protein